MRPHMYRQCAIPIDDTNNHRFTTQGPLGRVTAGQPREDRPVSLCGPVCDDLIPSDCNPGRVTNYTVPDHDCTVHDCTLAGTLCTAVL